MKKLLFLILTLKIFSYEVSEDIYRQLEETKLLLKENRITKAQQSLNYMLEWFSQEMNPLELDLVKYFQGEIFYLKEEFALAINSFNIVIENNNMDQDLLKKIEIKLPNGTPLRKIAEDYLDMATRYYNDAKHFEKQGNYVLAFAALNYAHGWLDAGARIGLFDV